MASEQGLSELYITEENIKASMEKDQATANTLVAAALATLIYVEVVVVDVVDDVVVCYCRDCCC